MIILVDLDGIERTLDVMGGYNIPRLYITDLQRLDVDVNDRVADIGYI